MVVTIRQDFSWLGFSKLWCGFLFAFHCNYGRIITTQWWQYTIHEYFHTTETSCMRGIRVHLKDEYHLRILQILRQILRRQCWCRQWVELWCCVSALNCRRPTKQRSASSVRCVVYFIAIICSLVLLSYLQPNFLSANKPLHCDFTWLRITVAC